MIESVGIIYYPLKSVWCEFGLIRVKPYFFSKNEIDIQDTDYIFITHEQVL
jgi:hypothetical protein